MTIKNKAYHVQASEYGLIVFATNSAAARREGACVLGCDWEDVEFCRRAQWADGYTHQDSIPVEVMLSNGWNYECNNCGTWFDNSEQNYKVSKTGGVYCCAKCHDISVDFMQTY